MHWIENVSRDCDGSIALVGRSPEGQLRRFQPEDFPHNLSVNNRTKYRLRVTDDAHRVTSVDDYLSAMGWTVSGEAQRLHRFEADGLSVWIPSQVMFKLVFSSAVSFYKLLFSPRSLHELAVTGSDEHHTLLPGWANSSNGWSDNEVRRKRLFWLLNSSSASRCWRQVFRNALDGTLDLPLPRGTFEIFVSGKRQGDLVLATDARLGSVVCSDLALPDGASISSRELDFCSATSQESRRTNRGLRFESIADISTWELSDKHFGCLLEWMFKNGLLQNPEHYGEVLKNRLRRHLNLLRARHLIPCEWKTLPCTKQELAYAQKRMYKLQGNGQWEPLREVLLALA
jgi:hypothetical protein